jgi:hypothetical protein
VLPTHGDSLAPPRPDRAESPVSALDDLADLDALDDLDDLDDFDDFAFIGPELPRLPDLPQIPERPALPVLALPAHAPAEPGSVRALGPVPVCVPTFGSPSGFGSGGSGPAAKGRTGAGTAARGTGTGFQEPKGCLFALSQPPLMLFLCVVGGLIGAGGAWDLIFL